MKPSGFAKFSVLPMMICLVVVLFAPKLHAQSKSVVTTKRYLTLDLLDVPVLQLIDQKIHVIVFGCRGGVEVNKNQLRRHGLSNFELTLSDKAPHPLPETFSLKLLVEKDLNHTNRVKSTKIVKGPSWIIGANFYFQHTETTISQCIDSFFNYRWSSVE